MLKQFIKKSLKLLGYDIHKSERNKITSFIQKKTRLPFSETIYNPRWRLKNYFALREFGESHKRWFIEQKYSYLLGEFPDLDNPKTFNEKIHWLNLNYQNELITKCCDKYEMKIYIKEKIGSKYVVPVLKVFNSANEINFDELPNKFAIKVNWGDGAEFSELVTDKKNVDINKIKFKMNNAIQPWNNLYYSHFFWGYKNVKPKIFVEQYLEHDGSDLNDYKVHCFNGEPKLILVCEDRSNQRMKKTFLDTNWNILPCRRDDGDVNPDVKKPNNLDEMLKIAKILSKPFPFVRVDFYNVNNQLYIGEMTFHPGCGFESFIPNSYNRTFGDMIVLPNKRIIE